MDNRNVKCLGCDRDDRRGAEFCGTCDGTGTIPDTELVAESERSLP